jgi:hypothetical protein
MPSYSDTRARSHPLTSVFLLICILLHFSIPSSFSYSLGQCGFNPSFPEQPSFHHCSFLSSSGSLSLLQPSTEGTLSIPSSSLVDYCLLFLHVANTLLVFGRSAAMA